MFDEQENSRDGRMLHDPSVGKGRTESATKDARGYVFFSNARLGLS